MRGLRTVAAAFHVLAAPLAAQSVTPVALHTALVGHWVGTLEYKDYGDASKRVTLPTIVDIAPRADGGTLLHFTYDDGPGKAVTGDDRFVLSADASALDWTGIRDTAPEIFRVVSLTRDGANGIRLVVEREGDDDHKPATLRETISAGDSEITILKEVRPTGAAFPFRHQYRLKRQR